MINDRFTQGRNDAFNQIKHGLARNWDDAGIGLTPFVGIGTKHFSSEYISGYSSAYDLHSAGLSA